MKVLKFNYHKAEEPVSNREVILLHNTKDYIDAIDLNKLNKEEAKRAFEIQERYEDDMKVFFKKAFRRFSKSKMEILK